MRGEKEKKLLSRFGEATRCKVVVLNLKGYKGPRAGLKVAVNLKGYKSGQKPAAIVFGNGLGRSKVMIVAYLNSEQTREN